MKRSCPAGEEGDGILSSDFTARLCESGSKESRVSEMAPDKDVDHTDPDVAVRILRMVGEVLGQNENTFECTLEIYASGRSNERANLQCGKATVLDRNAIQPLVAMCTAADGRFSEARVEALAQYAVARASQCVQPDGSECAGCLDRIRAEIAKDAAGSPEALKALAERIARRNHDCVGFRLKGKLLKAFRAPAGADGATVPLLELDVDAYRPEFAGIVSTIFMYLCYAAAVDPSRSSEYQQIATDTLATFAKAPAAPAAQTGGGAGTRRARMVVSGPLCPAHWLRG